ncbi:MAG: flavodoxin family protein [Dehalobacterium sp.]
MQVVAINGSHRKGKNTAMMLQNVLDELEKHGVRAKLVELADYNLNFCLGCNSCLSQNNCQIDDDMKKISDILIKANGIILGSPVYWENVTTRMKNFMDRTRFLHMKKNMLAGKVGAAVTFAGLRNGGQEFCLNVMENFLKSHGLILADTRNMDHTLINVGAMGTMQKDYDGNSIMWHKTVKNDLIALGACKQLGKNILQLLKILNCERCYSVST